MYRPLGSSPIFASLAVRVAPGKLSLSSAFRRAVQEIDKEQPVPTVLSVEEMISQLLWERRFTLWVAGLFALAALLLATIGVGDVMSYHVTQRSHEIGIRMALGAQPTDVVRLLVRQGFKVGLTGIVIGLVLASGLTRLVKSMLYGVTPADPMTFIAISLLLMIVTLLASYFPARRATAIHPITALRYE